LSTFFNRRRSRLAMVLATAVAALTIGAAPSAHGTQTARSSWSTMPALQMASVTPLHPVAGGEPTAVTLRSSWS
jgi:hypothetical protein